MNVSASLSRWAGALALLLAAPALALAQEEEFIEVKSVVNVLKGATVTDEQIKKAIAKANEILAQAKVEINNVKTNRNVSDKGNDDGFVTSDEELPMASAGLRELRAVFGDDRKGIKLYFVAGFGDQTTGGLSKHGFAISWVKNFSTAESTGYGIAHESSHNLCNGRQHKVDGTRTADDSGHINDPTNLMAPEMPEGGRGGKLTRDQIESIRKNAAKRGTVKKKAAQEGVPQRQQQKSGADADPRPGGSPEPSGMAPQSDIQNCGMFAASGQSVVEGEVFVHGRFDSTLVMNNTCWVYIDADANPATGVPRFVDGLMIGAEFVVEMHVTGDGLGHIQTGGILTNTGSGQSVPLDSISVDKVETIYESSAGAPRPASWDSDVLRFQIDATRLGSLVTPSSVGVQMLDPLVGTMDEAAFALHDWPAPQPDLTLDDYGVLPHAPVQALGHGFTPFAAVHLLLADSLVTTVYADFQGNFTVPFVAPAVADTFFFVNAREEAGGPSDFSILHVLGGPVAAEEDVPPGLRFDVVGGNPVAGEVRFALALPKRQQVRLAVYDAAGRRVAELLNRDLPAGDHQVTWSPRTESTAKPSGVYFARLEVGGHVLKRQFVVLR